MAMSIDDNAADKKSDKSRCQLLSFHCAAPHAGTQSAKIPQKILVASLNIPVILNQCGSLRSQSGQNQSSPSPELFRPDKGAVKGRNAPGSGPCSLLSQDPLPSGEAEPPSGNVLQKYFPQSRFFPGPRSWPRAGPTEGPSESPDKGWFPLFPQEGRPPWHREKSLWDSCEPPPLSFL